MYPRCRLPRPLHHLGFGGVFAGETVEEGAEGFDVQRGIVLGKAGKEFAVAEGGVKAVAAAQAAFELAVIVAEQGGAVPRAAVEVGDGGDVFERGAAGDLVGERDGAAKPPSAQQQAEENHPSDVEQRAPGRGVAQPIARPGDLRGSRFRAFAVMPFVEPKGTVPGNGADQVQDEFGVAGFFEAGVGEGGGVRAKDDAPLPLLEGDDDGAFGQGGEGDEGRPVLMLIGNRNQVGVGVQCGLPNQRRGGEEGEKRG